MCTGADNASGVGREGGRQAEKEEIRRREEGRIDLY